MIYFIAIDTYSHIPRNFFGFKKKNAPVEQRPGAIAVLSEDGQEFYSDAKKEVLGLLTTWFIGRKGIVISVDDDSFRMSNYNLPCGVSDNFSYFSEILMHKVPEIEFTHDNPNYANCISLLPGASLNNIDKQELLEEHKDWQHTAPGDLSLERARKARNNYLLLKSIVEKYQK